MYSILQFTRGRLAAKKGWIFVGVYCQKLSVDVRWDDTLPYTRSIVSLVNRISQQHCNAHLSCQQGYATKRQVAESPG